MCYQYIKTQKFCACYDNMVVSKTRSCVPLCKRSVFMKGNSVKFRCTKVSFTGGGIIIITKETAKNKAKREFKYIIQNVKKNVSSIYF